MEKENLSSSKPGEVYRKLEPDRHAYEYRAEKCAALSIPYLFPRQGDTRVDQFPTPYDSSAAYGVNTMASAISLALLPPTIPFFRLEMEGALELELRLIQDEFARQNQPERPLEEVQQSLGMWERAVVKEIERRNYRVGVHEAVRHLLVGGNCLIEHLEEGGLTVHPLRSYVVRRYPDSAVAEIVLKETKEKAQLSEDEVEAIKSVDWAWGQLQNESKVPIYTRITYDHPKGQYRVVQQIGELVVLEDRAVEGPIEQCPWWPLRFSRVSGEDYGRSYCEEYYGGIGSLDTTHQSLVEAGVLSAKVLFMVDPASGINPKSLSTAPNGAFRSGRADGVTTLQVQKNADMEITFKVWQHLQSQINRAFSTPEIRDAERVTAEEIRYLQQQLERSLGGSFPLLALDLQLPMARQIIKRLSANGSLPRLPGKDLIAPVIVTGIQALGRTMDSEKLTRFALTVQQIVGPAAAAQVIDQSVLTTRLATSEGIEAPGLIRSAEQIAAMNEAAQGAALQGKVTEKMVDAGGKVLTKAMPEGSMGQAA